MRTLAKPFIIFVERFYPDPFVFAAGLTLIVYLMAVGLTDAGPVETMVGWGDGLQGLLSFIAQISITLITAHALAHTDAVQRLLRRVGSLPGNPTAAYALVAFTAGVASLFAWALGLVAGALVARQVAVVGKQRGLRLHYPLLVASAYAGFVVWHMGYSSSSALFVATPGHILEDEVGIIPVTETIFAPWNIATALVALAAVTAICALMRPREDEIIELPDHVVEREERDATEEAEPDFPEGEATASGGAVTTATRAARSRTPAERLDASRVFSLLLGGGLALYLAHWFATQGLNLTLDIVNWSFLALGLLLSRSALHYVKLVSNASGTVGQIILQYPLYAGIMGMMETSGLTQIMSQWFVNVATPGTLGIWAFLSGGLVNFFVPSGGGQWAVQGPIFVEAARQLGTDPPRVVMGVAYGDQWTNMVQPFWTIPLLAIAGLHMRQIMGYTFVVAIVTGIIFSSGLLLAGAG